MKKKVSIYMYAISVRIGTVINALCIINILYYAAYLLSIFSTVNCPHVLRNQTRIPKTVKSDIAGFKIKGERNQEKSELI